MFSFIKRRFLYRFIIVYIYDTFVSVNTYDVKNKKILSSYTEDFELNKKDELTTQLIEYINKMQSEVTRSYVVTLLNSHGQGIIPTCSTSEYKDYSVDKRYIYNICVEKIFTNYASKIEINWLQKLFLKTGIDIIFSPFILLYDLIKQDSDISKTILYILYINHSLSMIITQDEKVTFGSYLNISEDENLLYSSYEENDEVEIEEEFEIEDDVELESDEEFELNEDEDIKEYEGEVELYEENKGFAKFLSNSLKEYYSNKIYNSSFVDKVKIFSEDDIDNKLLEYIENELFLSVEVVKIELDPLVIKYCEKEVIDV